MTVMNGTGLSGAEWVDRERRTNARSYAALVANIKTPGVRTRISISPEVRLAQRYMRELVWPDGKQLAIGGSESINHRERKETSGGFGIASITRTMVEDLMTLLRFPAAGGQTHPRDAKTLVR